MKLFNNIYLSFLFLIISIFIFLFALFNYQLSPSSNSYEIKTVVISPGSISDIADTLYKENLIKSTFCFKVYVKLSGKSNLKAATYEFSPSMGTKEIIDIMYNGHGKNSSELKITFKEGFDIPEFVNILVENTNNKESDIYSLLNDKEYLNTLINKYWFLTEDILNDKIYYSLEGYLYPNTYYFSSKDVDTKEIIEKMLDESENKLSDYKDKITNYKLSIHEIFTMASIVEKEGITEEDRKSIARVFFNRMANNMNLGSDVTTYYSVKVNMGERDLTKEELNDCNDYNTRCSTFLGLPISPISNPVINSIIAVLEPSDNNYYYFVADKNKNIYFSSNINEHDKVISKLKKEGKWYEY